MALTDAEKQVTFFIGGRLQQLALGLYEFRLGFDVASISVQHKIRVQKAGESLSELDADSPTQTKDLYYLLGRTVKNAQIDDEDTLTIVFDDDTRIMLSRSDNGYDSYVINHKRDILSV